jgi:hypothetical protein
MRLLKEPLLWVFVAGVALFAYFLRVVAVIVTLRAFLCRRRTIGTCYGDDILLI